MSWLEAPCPLQDTDELNFQDSRLVLQGEGLRFQLVMKPTSTQLAAGVLELQDQGQKTDRAVQRERRQRFPGCRFPPCCLCERRCRCCPQQHKGPIREQPCVLAAGKSRASLHVRGGDEGHWPGEPCKSKWTYDFRRLKRCTLHTRTIQPPPLPTHQMEPMEQESWRHPCLCFASVPKASLERVEKEVMDIESRPMFGMVLGGLALARARAQKTGTCTSPAPEAQGITAQFGELRSPFAQSSLFGSASSGPRLVPLP